MRAGESQDDANTILTNRRLPPVSVDPMHKRTLGRDRPLTVSALGLGCMGMSEFYGPGDDDESIATITVRSSLA
jgi:hypothetical protein